MILIYNCINDVHILYIHDKCLSICICTYIYIFIPTRFPKLVNSGWEKNTPASANPRKGLFGMVKFFFFNYQKTWLKNLLATAIFSFFEARLRCEGILCGQHCHPARPCSSNINQSGVAAATRRSKQRKRRAISQILSTTTTTIIIIKIYRNHKKHQNHQTHPVLLLLLHHYSNIILVVVYGRNNVKQLNSI